MIPASGGNAAADLAAAAARLAAASAPVLSAIARAQPLINPETVASPTADQWSSAWQAEAAAVVRYLAYALPAEAEAAVSAAQRAQAAATAAATAAGKSG